MKKSTIAATITLMLGSSSVGAVTITSGAFNMLGPTGVVVDTIHTNSFIGTIGNGTWQVNTTSSFLGANWTAYNGTTFGPGTYSFDASNNQDGSLLYTGITVGEGQVGGHILWEWNIPVDMDMVLVWDVACDGVTCSYTIIDNAGFSLG